MTKAATKVPVPSVGDALRLQVRAANSRAHASAFREDGDEANAALEEADAARLDDAVAAAFDTLNHATGVPAVGAGGEMVVPTQRALGNLHGLMDTVRERPGMLAASASLERLELAGEVGALVLAADMAETVQAQNSVERSLAHQMAATHAMAMRFLASAGEELAADERTGWKHPQRSVEASRKATTAARLLDTFSRSVAALDRLRNGGRQVVTVQHVKVEDGGQAVVAGSLRTGRSSAE